MKFHGRDVARIADLVARLEASLPALASCVEAVEKISSMVDVASTKVEEIVRENEAFVEILARVHRGAMEDETKRMDEVMRSVGESVDAIRVEFASAPEALAHVHRRTWKEHADQVGAMLASSDDVGRQVEAARMLVRTASMVVVLAVPVSLLVGLAVLANRMEDRD